MKQEKLAFIQQNAPCYLYDNRKILEQCQALRTALPGVEFLYSIKANPFAPVVESIAGQGFGADAASANEVMRATQAGIPQRLIFYSAPGKIQHDLEKSWGKCTVIADSFSELALMEKLASQKNEQICVGVRLNPNFSMGGSAATPSKFGIDEDQFFSSAMNLPHVRISGLHIHLRSQVLEADVLSSYYQNCYDLAERLNKLPNVKLSFINFGSGIGTVYDAVQEKPLDFEKLQETMLQLQQRNSLSLKAKLIIETGRFLVCNAGTYYTRVVDRKKSCGKTFVVVQNSLNGFLRPVLAELLRKNLGTFPIEAQEPLFTAGWQSSFKVLGKSVDVEKVDIVGNLCTALDVMASNIDLPRAEVGDIIEVSNAGSYGYTLTPQSFSSQEPAKEFLWK